MSLRPDSFDQFFLGGDQIDLVEVRLGTGISINLNWYQADKTTVQDITNYTVTLSYYDATATITEPGNVLTNISNITLLTATAMTDANLIFTKITPLMGKSAIYVPPTVTNMPSTSVPITGETTLVKLIKYQYSYPSTITPTKNEINLNFLGLIIRWGG